MCVCFNGTTSKPQSIATAVRSRVASAYLARPNPVSGTSERPLSKRDDITGVVWGHCGKVDNLCVHRLSAGISLGRGGREGERERDRESERERDRERDRARETERVEIRQGVTSYIKPQATNCDLELHDGLRQRVPCPLLLCSTD